MGLFCSCDPVYSHRSHTPGTRLVPGIILTKILEWAYFYCWYFSISSSASLPYPEQASLQGSSVRTWSLSVDSHPFCSPFSNTPRLQQTASPDQCLPSWLSDIPPTQLSSQRPRDAPGCVCLAKHLFITISGIWNDFCFLLNIYLHSWVDFPLVLGFLREISGFFLPSHTRDLLIDAIEASSVTTALLPSLEQAYKAHITTPVRAVSHTLPSPPLV